MNPIWESYLRKTVGMADPLVERVGQIQTALESVFSVPLDDLFVSEFIDGDNTRQYTALYFFTDEHVVQAPNFVTSDKFDIDYVKNSVANLSIDRTSFDFITPTADSRVQTDYATTAHMRATMTASRDNCVKLTEIIKSRLVPNFHGSGTPVPDGAL